MAVAWSRSHIQRLSEIEVQLQQLSEEIGAESVGIDGIILANECLTEAQAAGLAYIELREHKQMAREFANALRPFCVEGQ